MKKRIACVEWDDATFDSGYYDKQDTSRYDVLKTLSVGFVVKSTPKEIILAVDSWVNKQGTEYRHITTIPKKMVRKVTEFEAKK